MATDKAYKVLAEQKGISNKKAKELIDRGLVFVEDKKVKIARAEKIIDRQLVSNTKIEEILNGNFIYHLRRSTFVKKDLEKINGFDEDFTLPTTGEDTDIERRLRYFGIKMKSCRYCANVIHLYHKKVFNPDITSKTETLMETKKDQFICKMV